MKLILAPQATISHFMTYGGPEFITMIQKNNIVTCIIFISVGRGQYKAAGQLVSRG